MQRLNTFSTTTAMRSRRYTGGQGAFRGTPLVEGRAYGWMLNCVRCWADRRQVGDFGHWIAGRVFLANGGEPFETPPPATRQGRRLLMVLSVVFSGDEGGGYWERVNAQRSERTTMTGRLYSYVYASMRERCCYL